MASFSLMEGTLKTCGPKSSFSFRIPIKVPTKIHVRKATPLSVILEFSHCLLKENSSAKP